MIIKRTKMIIAMTLGFIFAINISCYATDFEKNQILNSRHILIGTIVKDNPRDSLAIIRDSTNDKDASYKVGQILDGYYIVRIKRAEVELLRQGKISSLRLPLGGGAEFITIVSGNERIVNRTALNERYKNLNEVFGAGIVFPHIEKGKLAGLKIVRINDEELAKATGVSEGDIVISVNNQKLTGVKQALDVYNKLRNEEEIELELKRNGKLHKYSYYMNWEEGGKIPRLLKEQKL
ncbi:MAG: PDZ domain-containing protein [Candidatus Omnitrophica bacterium]|nr:PDZ domain-containing protein [Candidatus Omnitrophota bacterium]